MSDAGAICRDMEELAIIRKARRVGRKLRIEPQLTDCRVIRDREAVLAGRLFPNGEA